MNLKDLSQTVREIGEIFKKNRLKYIDIKYKDLKITINKPAEVSIVPSAYSVGVAPPISEPKPPVSPIQVKEDIHEDVDKKDENIEQEGYYQVKSPIIGTFYRAPSPESPPFVKEGDSVDPDTTVCIVEAMKIMNEIKAEVSGKVAKILVKNAESVSEGQVLMLIEEA